MSPLQSDILRKKNSYIIAYLPPGNRWNGFRFAWLLHVFPLIINRSDVLVGVDCAPPDGGLVHVLLVGHPHVHLVGVIELAAEGDLTLK